MLCFAASPIKKGFEHILRKEKRAKNVKKVELKICPRLS